MRRPASAGASAVAGLFRASSPPDVAGLVMSIIVNAVDGMPRARPWPYVSKECLEGVRPLVADGNTPTAVIRERVTGRGEATGLHAGPYPVFGCGPAHWGTPVTRGPFNGHFVLVAAAGFDVASYKGPSGDGLDCAALTATRDHSVSVGLARRRMRQDRHSRKPLAYVDGNRASHGLNYTARPGAR